MSDDRKLEVMEKVVGGVVETMTGIDFVGGALGFLRDPKAPAPVVPPDLHLVKPAKVDADGNVACIFCGRHVRWEAAELVGSAGFACGTCQRPVIAEPASLDIRRRRWPWLVAGAAGIVAIVAGIVHVERARDREELERAYPVEPSAGVQAVIDRNLDRWKPDALVAAIEKRPPLAALHTAGACDVEPGAFELDAAKDNARERIDELVASARRGRFRIDWEQTAVVLAIPGPVLVVDVREHETPKLATGGEKLAFDPGHRAGVAYLYDVGGTLRCAGAFEAESSGTVSYDAYEHGNPASSADRMSAQLSIEGDLDARVRTAIVQGLHRVE